ncbi:MAG TPA: hypothetical protein VMS17_08435 [Gemmataceae bacterium]|nr:hypothetical protein [Gemmataceae bacterium]
MNWVDGEFLTSGTGEIQNRGTLEKTAGTLDARTDLPIVNIGGDFQLQDGKLNITGSDGNGSFDQTSGTTDLWEGTTLMVHSGYDMQGGVLWTEGASGSTATINGDVNIIGGVVNLLHNTQTETGILSVTGNLKIQYNGEYDAKIDSTNLTADKISVNGTVTLGGTTGGNSTLKTVSINLNNGKVAVGQQWNILSSGSANINGDFDSFILDFNDGTGKKYNAGPSNKNYFVKS